MQRFAQTEKEVKRFMLWEVQKDPIDWITTEGDYMATELAEAAADYFGVHEWLLDDTHPIWEWSVEVLDQIYHSYMEDEYEKDLGPLLGNYSSRRAVSNDPYNRALERFETAVRRKGILPAFADLQRRIKAVRNPDKLQGIADMLFDLREKLDWTDELLRRKM